ncbi:MAG: universal stress protein [Chloroflexota bacterium]
MSPFSALGTMVSAPMAGKAVVHSEWILAALDGSPLSRGVLQVARGLARASNLPLHVLHVSDAPLSASELVDSVGLSRDDLPGLVLDSAAGPAEPAIVAAVKDPGCSLLVMGTRGWGNDPVRSLGHVAYRVLGDVHCAVVLVPPVIAPVCQPQTDAPLNILLPLEGTPTVAETVPPVLRFLDHKDHRLFILHVVHPEGNPPDQARAFTVPMYVDQPHHSWPRWVDEFTMRFCRDLDDCPREMLISVGDAGENIVRAAIKHGAHYIVLTWHGRFDDDRARTVRTVLESTPCPVMFLRASEELSAQESS